MTNFIIGSVNRARSFSIIKSASYKNTHLYRRHFLHCKMIGMRRNGARAGLPRALYDTTSWLCSKSSRMKG